MGARGAGTRRPPGVGAFYLKGTGPWRLGKRRGIPVSGRLCRIRCPELRSLGDSAAYPDQTLLGRASLLETDLSRLPLLLRKFGEKSRGLFFPLAKGTPSATHRLPPHCALAPRVCTAPRSRRNSLCASNSGLPPRRPRRRGRRLAAQAGGIEPGAGRVTLRRKESQTSASRGPPWDPLAPPRLRCRRQSSRRWLKSRTECTSRTCSVPAVPARFLDQRPFPPSAPPDCREGAVSFWQNTLAKTEPRASVSRSVSSTLGTGLFPSGSSS